MTKSPLKIQKVQDKQVCQVPQFITLDEINRALDDGSVDYAAERQLDSCSPIQENFPSSGWTFNDVVSALHYVACPVSLNLSGFSMDSRTLQPGQCFLPMKGEHFDGHDYIEEAFQKGASMCLSERSDIPALQGHSYLVVDDVLRALNDLAVYARSKSMATIIAVSGSVGKTTTRTWISRLLSSFGSVCSTLHNYNGRIGLPFSLLQLKQQGDIRYGVFEVGIDQKGSMEALAQLCRPHVVVMQDLAMCHTEFFQSMDELAAEKAKLIDGLESNGILVIHEKTLTTYPIFPKKIEKKGDCQIVTVGTSPFSTAFVQKSEPNFSNGQTEVKASVAGIPISYTIPCIGDHFVIDSLMALVAVIAALSDKDFHSIMHEDWNAIYPELDMMKLSPVTGRGGTLKLKDGITIIDSSYNANPASMQAELNSFCHAPCLGRRIAVVGDMLELGDQTQAEHQKIFEFLHKHVDKVFAIGSLCKQGFDVLDDEQKGVWSCNVDDIIDPLLKFLGPNDKVFVKASHAINLDAVIAACKRK